MSWDYDEDACVRHEENCRLAHWAEQHGWIHEDDLEEKLEALKAADEMKYNLAKAKSALRGYLYCIMDDKAYAGCTSHTREQMMAWSLSDACEALDLGYTREQFSEFFKKSA